MEGHDHFGWVGQIIDAKYRVDRAVDEGSFGVVYQAHHLKFDEKVALKCLKLPQGLRGQVLDEFSRRFVAEGRFLHRLSRSNTNIVQALDVGAELAAGGEWVPYLVLEWLEGVSLADDLERRARDGQGGRGLEGALALLEPAALALGTAHEQRVAHCDVKPANLFLTSVGGRPTLKVLDFGIAKFADEQFGHELATGEGGETICAFSPFYAAPEQFDRDHGPTSPATDVFALALVLVEVASGRSALEGQSIAELFHASSDRARRPSLRARGVSCSEAADEVVRRALSVRPGDRFASASDFWRALTEAAGVRPAAPLEAAPSSPALVRAAPLGPERATPADASGAFRADGEAAASTGEHPASIEPPAPEPAPARAKNAKPPRPARSTLGPFVAMASGAALSFVALHRGLVFGAEPTPPLASRLDASMAPDVGARLLARLGTFTPASTGAAPTSADALAKAAGNDAGATTGAAAGAPPALTTPVARAEGDGDFTLRPLGAVGSLDAAKAARECAKAGMALCTDAQWQLACEGGAPLGAAEAWVSSADTRGPAVRGGAGACAGRRLALAAETLPAQGQTCCAPALEGERRASASPPSPAALSAPRSASR